MLYVLKHVWQVDGRLTEGNPTDEASASSIQHLSIIHIIRVLQNLFCIQHLSKMRRKIHNWLSHDHMNEVWANGIQDISKRVLSNSRVASLKQIVIIIIEASSEEFSKISNVANFFPIFERG